MIIPSSLTQEAGHLFSVEELSLLLQVSEKTIYYWVGRHEIPFLKIGRHVRFVATEVLESFKKKMDDSARPCLRGSVLVKNLLTNGKSAFRGSLAIRDQYLAETEKE